MKEHTFTLILSRDPTDAEADRLYGICQDGTLSTIAGIAHVHFHRESASLEAAMRSAIDDVRQAGLDIERVELQPNELVPVA